MTFPPQEVSEGRLGAVGHILSLGPCGLVQALILQSTLQVSDLQSFKELLKYLYGDFISEFQDFR